jgi:hypothetical protein
MKYSIRLDSATDVKVFQGEDDTLIFETWSDQILKRTCISQIKDIYTDGVFGAPSFLASKMVFIGEKSKEKFKKGWWKEPAENPKNIDKFKYRPSFGEKYTKTVAPVLCVFDLKTHDFRVFEKAGLAFASPIFVNPKNILAVGYEDKFQYQRPGVSVCFNRPSGLYLIQMGEEAGVTQDPVLLTEGIYLCLAPVLSFDRSIVAFVGKREPFTTHCTKLDVFTFEIADDRIGSPEKVQMKNEEGLFLVLHS